PSSGRLFQEIQTFIADSGCKGICLFAPLDVYLDDTNVFQPDLLYLSEERKAALVKEGIEGAPDLVIEILSPATAYYDLRQKKDIYEHFGVKEYIIVDPVQKNIELYILEDGAFVLREKASVPGRVSSALLSGLVFDLTKLFA